ncbi:delta-class carbonic anhydrase [Pseudohongiella sp.]|uniref:Cadmium carbonic anhydrase n=1 Tax=marine sediment metagenome TaxID=412755 RepID=A0A0F9XIV6_9ZZZZ|nr:delta-class carbonic anhydrase [Pseudohongiella sp.]HDZ08845.1 hypothetical protein [Pseudohongiella sp.]HEA62822.1 hypothetical protein [Pseudohongiella sp.]
MKYLAITIGAIGMSASLTVSANDHGAAVADSVIDQQNQTLLENTAGQGFGPQSPRDLSNHHGDNQRIFSMAPAHDEMNLCNIHFHASAEHKGGQFTSYAGNGDGHGNHTGFVYDGELASALLAPVSGQICPANNASLQPGDTIEVHYVFSSAQIAPGPTLGACLNDNTMNTQLRVEGQVFVLVNDRSALDFSELAAIGERNGYHQALNIPTNTGSPIQYAGSTTGPAYNENGSPLLVSWSVRPEVAFVDIETVGDWCNDNVFAESAAHGVRNLVTAPALLSPIE